ncbi:hypothetical protein APHAL10511_003489 [Amanita phalloides]|nr:hypothetical protein APHAL10511_003489 [Amanita phalloides]
MSAERVTVESTAEQPIMLGDGFHTSDLGVNNAEVDESIQAIQTSALAYMKTRLAEWSAPEVSSNAKE